MLYRNRPLRSRTVDTLVHILSVCYADSDKGMQIDVPFNCIYTITNDSLCQEQESNDAKEDGLYDKPVESSENISRKNQDLSQKVNTNSQDTYDIICDSPKKDNVEEGEISGDFMDDTKSEHVIDFESETGLKNENNLIPLFSEAVENGGKDVAGVVNKTTRNLVDYSEIGFDAKSQESATKNHALVSLVKKGGSQNNKKRQVCFTLEENRNKKSKKSVDPITAPENLTLLDASQEDVDASANKAACNGKKKKRVVTKERKAKKKMKERIKRAEKNRKLGIRRLKLQPVIKEKKITYCRHYMHGRCHEGEKCKFSHDATPLTKSKPCCHFARHTCMKGDDCPYDHQLSKYPCKNYQTKGICNRGSDCMFSHEVQPSDAALDESKPEPCLNLSPKQIETKSCSIPKFVDITPKAIRPPKGISFLSQEKLPLSPKIDSEVKEITKTPLLIQDSNEKTTMPPVVQDSKEITKTPPVLPRGISFLSFGKKPANDGFTFRISNRVEMSRLSDNVVNKVKVDFSTDRPSYSKQPMPMMSFMSSTSQKALQSTLAFASKLDFGVKSIV